MLVKFFTPRAALPTNALPVDSSIGNKRIFFITKCLNSIRQYSSVFNVHTNMSVAEYVDTSMVKDYSPQEWLDQSSKYNIHLMLDDAFESLVQRGFVNSSHISLLVLDDVHLILLQKPPNDSYSRIIEKLKSPDFQKRSFPILGLSASILIENVTSNVFRTMINRIESQLACTCQTYADLRVINKYSVTSRIQMRFYSHFNSLVINESNVKKFQRSIKKIYFFTNLYKSNYHNTTTLSLPLDEQEELVSFESVMALIHEVLYVYGTLGEWCALRLIIDINTEVCGTILFFQKFSSAYCSMMRSLRDCLVLIQESILSYLPPSIT